MSELTLIPFESNERVAIRVKTSLLQLGYPQMAGITCEAQGSTVFLKGELGSYYLAQVAQSIAKKVPGVRNVVNRLQVALAV